MQELLRFLSLQVSWTAMLTWAAFGRSWFSSRGSVITWEGGPRLLGLGKPRSEVWQLLAVSESDRGTGPYVSFIQQCSFFMWSSSLREEQKGSGLLEAKA